MSDTQVISRVFNGRAIPLAGIYALDPAHTFAEFVTQHLVIGRVRGRFDKVAGTATIAEDPYQSSLDVAIETASISTHNEQRDEDLRSARFFDVARFPTMTYRGSGGIIADVNGEWTIQGNLTIRDVTLAVPLTGRLMGIVVDPMGKVRAGLQGRAEVSRKDFGLLADLEREHGGLIVGKDVLISIDAEALRQG
jgi:polyisoprenoid-binding protein YceI